MVEEPPKRELVQPIDSLGRISFSDLPATAWPVPDYDLTIAGVYQDAATREWATQVASHAIQLVGQRSAHSTWWKIGELGEPRFVMDAVQAAVTADLLIVAVRAADKMPFDLYEWIESWLPHRFQSAGALIALIGAPEQPGIDASHLRRYLQEVAWRADLEFLSQVKTLPLEFPNLPRAETRDRVPADTQMFGQTICVDHWGLNE